MARPADSNDWRCSLVGQTVEKYRLLRFIGRGRIGYVYQAELKDFPEAPFAIKLIFGTLKVGWENELRKVMKLQMVQNVVHFHGLGADHVKHGNDSVVCQYTVWDYIAPGQDLKKYLERVERVPVTFVFAVVERVLHVLHACQRHEISQHGDLHPGNILIGDESNSLIDDHLQPREPVYISDFGYGTTGGAVQPKDDYLGLVAIFNEMMEHVDYETATPTDRQLLNAMRTDLTKLLREPAGTERRKPFDLLEMLKQTKQRIQSGEQTATTLPYESVASPGAAGMDGSSVGQFQVSEMIGDQWEWWRRLFVPSVPSSAKILARDIPTVVTGPRGCGKTMFFRRLSERLIVECGDVPELRTANQFVAFYVNANDFGDAFAHFPDKPSADDERRLTCYANLCILADLLTVQSARAGRGERVPDGLLTLVQGWLVPKTFNPLLIGEDRLGRYRAVLEQTKWEFGKQGGGRQFPGYGDLSQHRWLPELIRQARTVCPWMAGHTVLVFVDDFSTPRISASMQRVLNRLLLQRSPEFLAKVATEARSTFIPEDSSNKALEDGDDFQFVDMGEESLFLPDAQRLAFLEEVFSRRLATETRMPKEAATLRELLGRQGISKTEFARQLRSGDRTSPAPVQGASQRRGPSRARVHYYGEDIFANLWSGDTRMMIQLVSDVFELASGGRRDRKIAVPVDAGIQDKAFRDRGGEWLNSHTRNEPTDSERVRAGITEIKKQEPDYELCGTYGSHLKAIVEAYVEAATRLLRGPTYRMNEGGKTREVPRMAFRLEIVDEFRLDGLAAEIYRDLVRYGLFMVDNRGKSVRGAFVPRLYLRRLLLPFCTLALSKRDSVPLRCEQFRQLLLRPDTFKSALSRRQSAKDQFGLFGDAPPEPGPEYDDLGGAD
jgi:hypothetical protein